MRKLGLLALATAAATLAIGSAASAACVSETGDCDALILNSGGVTITRSAIDEQHEFFQVLQAFDTPAGFTDATVTLLEPGSGDVSDRFTLLNDPLTNHVNAYFLSDGASASEVASFVSVANQFTITETGNFQDVSSYFGQSAGFAQILSDVPEPATWAMMLVGFGAAGGMIRSRRRTQALA
jgi:hypothetical protein